MTDRQGSWEDYRIPRLAYPFACLGCRKSFKRNVPLHAPPDELPCPQCAGPAVRLSRKFKPPARTDTAQWAKVKALVDAGFRFESMHGYAQYPATLGEVDAFLRKYGNEAYMVRRRRQA